MTAATNPRPVHVVRRGVCGIDHCGQPARLYPHGWLCNQHRPQVKAVAP